MRGTELALVAAALVAIASTPLTVTIAAAMLTITELALLPVVALVVAIALLAKAIARTIALLAMLAPFARGRALAARGCLRRRLFVSLVDIASSVMAMPLALVAFAGLAGR